MQKVKVKGQLVQKIEWIQMVRGDCISSHATEVINRDDTVSVKW